MHKHVHHLVEKNYLRKAWNRSRSVEPIEEERGGPVTLPLLGTVAAGTPIEAIEGNESIEVPQEMAGRPGERFVFAGSGGLDDRGPDCRWRLGRRRAAL